MNPCPSTAAKYRAVRPLLLVMFALTFGMLSACTSAPDQSSIASAAAGSCSLNLPDDTDDETAIRSVLSAEGEQVVNQDIDALMRLWSEDGRVSDAKNTPESDTDDQNWDGKDAIRHRYVRTVFPGAPASVQPSDLVIEINGDSATVTATTRIGDEISPAGDRWQLVRVDGCWLLQSLTYNLEPAP